MDIGSGIAIGSTVLGTVAVTFKIFDRKKSCNEGGQISVCAEHSGVKATLENIKETGERHEEWLKSISSDLKKLLTKGA